MKNINKVLNKSYPIFTLPSFRGTGYIPNPSHLIYNLYVYMKFDFDVNISKATYHPNNFLLESVSKV